VVGRLLGIAGLSVVLAAPARAQTGATAPAYPSNTITLTAPGPIVAATAVKVKWTGHADWKAATDATTIPYDLALFVQNADVLAHCAPTYGRQLQNSINLNLNASSSPTGFVVDGTQHVAPNPPNQGLDWSGDSLAFALKPGSSHVVLCGYQRFIIDDVAYYELPVKVEQPTCKPTHATIRRGAKLPLECNVKGSATVVFTGAEKRTVKVTISTTGDAKVSTGSLKAGRYHVTVVSNGVQLGKPRAVRIR
jgi:hypothetical protein